MCAQKVDWESLGAGDKANGKTAFIRFKAGDVKNLRLVGHAVEFYKFYIEGESPKSVMVDPDKYEAASKVLSQHAGKEIAPSHRYAVNVIDRDDDGAIKILEGGWSIFKMFANWAKINGQHPGGKGGADWNISAKGERLNREYTTMPGQSTPFTPEEIDRIQVKKELYSLNELFKSCPLEDLIEKAFGVKAEPDTPSGQQQPVQMSQSANATSATSVSSLAASSGLSNDPADW